jgi:aspartyl-tRNA(Asn)/glutamyl-tRNA(Gln) amidotransferase subunit A
MHLHDLTIKKFHEGLINKEFSALEVAKVFYDYIATRDEEIGAYLSLSKDEAFLQAEQADLAVARGEEVSMLAGVPLAIKDNLLIKDQPATAASKILEGYRGVYDATVIAKLKKAKAVFLGKANMDEFAMGSSTENSSFKKTKNPHDLERVPGGSSGGSAAAVASHMAVAALGSDTGGSIRQPAGFCGVVGLKPTYGAVSRNGLIAMASSLDQIGPITKTVEDAAILFKEIAGRDQFDATTAAHKYGEELLDPKLEEIKKITVGIPEEYFALPSEAGGEGRGAGVQPEVQKAMDETRRALESLGVKFKKISLPHTKHALSCYYIIMPAEVSTNLARFDGIRYPNPQKHPAKNLWELYKKNKSRGFGPETKRRVILGAFVLSAGHYDAYYAKAQKVRALMKKDFTEAFKEVDVIFTPTSPTVPFRFGEKTNDPLSMYLSDVMTIPTNLAGVPAISIPVKNQPLPIGFQLIGKWWQEKDILGLGSFYERLEL